MATEARSHSREEASEPFLRRFSGFEPLTVEDIADAIGYIVTRPRRGAVNELLIRPIEQEA